jgi:multicomponent Na+:H+ antiporter subunit B
MKRGFLLLSALSLSGLLMLAVVSAPPTGKDPAIVDLLIERAPLETGATNLVSAIYLGYRAYDTLGEALVLLLAVTGVITFARRENA